MFFHVCVCDDKVYLLLYVFVTLLLVTNPLNLFNNKLKPRVINHPIYHPPTTQPLDFNCQNLLYFSHHNLMPQGNKSKSTQEEQENERKKNKKKERA